MTRTEGANAAGIIMSFEMNEMLIVVEDSMALFINCNTGWPESMIVLIGTIGTNVPVALVKIAL